jgi:hypothetical protein
MNKSLLGICYFFSLSGCAVLTAGCDEIPVDPTPVWSLANRYALEMANDCNSSNHSLGISGCAVVAKKDVIERCTVLRAWPSFKRSPKVMHAGVLWPTRR